MSSTLTATRTALVVGLVSIGLVGPTVVGAAHAAPGRNAGGYSGEVVGPRATSSGHSYGTTARGIANSGDVLVASTSQPTFIANGRRVRALASAEKLTPYGAYPQAITGSGHVYGSGYEGLFRWNGARVTMGKVKDLNASSFQGFSLSAVNTRGDVAGCAQNYRVGVPFVGSYQSGSVTSHAWPSGWGNCSVTGISDRGVATINQEAPSWQYTDIYPRAATMTTRGVTFLRAPAGTASSADAISPNGARIAGRTIDKDGRATTVWLSHRSNPTPLRGAGGLTPRIVTDSGVVFGVKDGRAVRWQNGRTTDLTSISRLQRGWVISDVSGINARGQLAVTAQVGADETVAMRLTPR
ncbi:MAG: hypothetical protein Q4G43_15380 [Mobilicoccus sp.]|nr:hypothetical protein [Mobilicoccus sp.]